VWFHPGLQCQNAVIRWTAPASGRYIIDGWFTGRDFVYPTTTDVAVLKGTAVTFSGAINSYDDPLKYSLAVSMNSGETLDFTVGCGRNENYTGDSTGIHAVIQKVSPDAAIDVHSHHFPKRIDRQDTCEIPGLDHADSNSPAFQSRDLPKVKTALERHPALVSCTDKYGMTPLHWAAQRDLKDMAELLLDYKADVNAKDSIAGWTPLHVAALEGRKGMVKLLLANRADVNARTNKGETPLQIAAQYSHPEVVELLRRRGDNRNNGTPDLNSYFHGSRERKTTGDNAIPRNGLAGEWLFNGNAKDTSGNGNHGTIHGEVVLSRDRFGNDHRAYKLNGVDGYIKAKADNLPRKDRTVSLWFNVNSISTNPCFLGYGGGVCGTSWFMSIGPSYYGGPTAVYGVSSHCDVNSLVYKFPYSPEEIWRHFAVETGDSGTKMYLDGSLVVSNNNYVSNTDTVGKDLSMGVDVSASGYAPYTDINVGYLNGYLDDVRIYSRALSESEILALYHEGGWKEN
jgi:hypothetical protein